MPPFPPIAARSGRWIRRRPHAILPWAPIDALRLDAIRLAGIPIDAILLATALIVTTASCHSSSTGASSRSKEASVDISAAPAASANVSPAAAPSDPAATTPPATTAASTTAPSTVASGGTTPVAAPVAPPALDAGRPRGRVLRVAAVGDSLTDRASGGGGYLRYLEKRCPESRFDNFGKGGAMVNQMRRRFEQQVFPPGGPRYTHVIVFGGVNDLYSDETAGRVPRTISPDLGAMYDSARSHGAAVVAITVTPWGGFSHYFNGRRRRATLELNAWIMRQADTGRVDHVIDAYPLLSCGVSTHLCARYKLPFRDGLHFGPVGHERLGRALHEQVFRDCA